MEECVFFFGFAVAGILTWGGILGYQCVRWLQDGHWLPIAILDCFHRAGIYIQSTGWIGLDKIIDWIVDWPVSALPFFASLGFLMAAIEAFTSERKRRDLARRGLGGPYYR